eukprot:CAMPEP_0117007136 /NCGR_PEP_ID=MMETSP0472-20121206/7113_1 /TAXON_ID=693140 ORGANISM="Tiarina fusus, Strain LIS" /NCGR_SAMPLE_ID=MMETSP0472 /ASSEMBLY_ACC=CAM_ASM_000603 /LENGTH=46 /DNA_ID= /DNA_START= /DNA_END= /DNA_ORIENTATION=
MEGAGILAGDPVTQNLRLLAMMNLGNNLLVQVEIVQQNQSGIYQNE